MIQFKFEYRFFIKSKFLSFREIKFELYLIKIEFKKN
jgi:hypothetical protein